MAEIYAPDVPAADLQVQAERHAGAGQAHTVIDNYTRMPSPPHQVPKDPPNDQHGHGETPQGADLNMLDPNLAHAAPVAPPQGQLGRVDCL